MEDLSVCRKRHFFAVDAFLQMHKGKTNELTAYINKSIASIHPLPINYPQIIHDLNTICVTERLITPWTNRVQHRATQRQIKQTIIYSH